MADIKDTIAQYKLYAKNVLRPQASATFTVPVLGLDGLDDKDVLKQHKKLFSELLFQDNSILETAKSYYKAIIEDDIAKRFSDDERAALEKLVDQLVMNYQKALSGILTKEKRKHQICKTFDIKLKPKGKRKGDLDAMRREAKNVYNYILDVDPDNYDYRSDVVEVLNPVTGEREKRKLEHINQQTRQAILSQVKDAIRSLASKKAKGQKVGRLKFKSQVDMVPLKQYGKTHYIADGKCQLKICGIKQTIYVRGLDQVRDWEAASAAKLVWKADGVHLMLTCYKDKEKVDETNHKYRKPATLTTCDFGVGDALTFADDTKVNILLENSETWRQAERRKSSQVKGSRGRKKTVEKIRLAALRDSYKKEDAANKVCALIAKNEICITQDDDISAWKKGNSLANGSKKIQKGILGRVKAGLKERGGVYMIPRFVATTQVCPSCHEKTAHPLDEQGNVTCSHCHFEYPRNTGAAWSMEHVATQEFPGMLPEWFSPIDASGSVEETMVLARKRSAWDKDMERNIDSPSKLDAVLGHVEDKSHAGKDMSGRKRPRVKDGWESKKRTRGKQDKWDVHSPSYAKYVRVGEEPEHAEEPVVMTSSSNSKEAKQKRNLANRKRLEAKRAIFFGTRRKRRAERERSRCESRDARRSADGKTLRRRTIRWMTSSAVPQGLGEFNAGGDRSSRRDVCRDATMSMKPEAVRFRHRS